MSCLFCEIAAGHIPAAKEYEDDRIMVFRDIAPQAPVHLIAIPKEHFVSAREITEEQEPLAGHLISVLARLAGQMRLDEGFRLVINIGPNAGQTVGHLHMHLLGGKLLPPLG